uniref:Tissue factor pathway inhibitor n=1 Tax=Monopterus albus TaxID=43700 RepID=A0A3Q3JJR9_MONAL
MLYTDYHKKHNKTLHELFIFEELCSQKDDPGPCKAIKERFFFNINTGTCEQFEYGGCGGNANNFETLKACEETCVVSDDKSPCHLAEAPGPCRGLVTRYFFDSESQQCKAFFYGGCFGNANNFRSMAACQAKCQNQAVKEHISRLSCFEAFLCGIRRAQGQPALLSSTHSKSYNFMNSVSCQKLKPEAVCFSPVDRGTCHGAEKRFAYNTMTKRCQMFQYSGCGGNENNFMSRRHCNKKCRKGMIILRSQFQNACFDI